MLHTFRNPSKVGDHRSIPLNFNNFKNNAFEYFTTYIILYTLYPIPPDCWLYTNGHILFTRCSRNLETLQMGPVITLNVSRHFEHTVSVLRPKFHSVRLALKGKKANYYLDGNFISTKRREENSTWFRVRWLEVIWERWKRRYMLYFEWSVNAYCFSDLASTFSSS